MYLTISNYISNSSVSNCRVKFYFATFIFQSTAMDNRTKVFLVFPALHISTLWKLTYVCVTGFLFYIRKTPSLTFPLLLQLVLVSNHFVFYLWLEITVITLMTNGNFTTHHFFSNRFVNMNYLQWRWFLSLIYYIFIPMP